MDAHRPGKEGSDKGPEHDLSPQCSMPSISGLGETEPGLGAEGSRGAQGLLLELTLPFSPKCRLLKAHQGLHPNPQRHHMHGQTFASRAPPPPILGPWGQKRLAGCPSPPHVTKGSLG